MFYRANSYHDNTLKFSDKNKCNLRLQPRDFFSSRCSVSASEIEPTHHTQGLFIEKIISSCTTYYTQKMKAIITAVVVVVTVCYFIAAASGKVYYKLRQPFFYLKKNVYIISNIIFK